MRLFCILNTDFRPRVHGFLEQAALERGIEFIVIEGENCDLTDLLHMEIEEGDMMYRAGLSTQAKLVELMLDKKGVVKLDKNNSGLIWDDIIKMQISGVPVIPMIFGLSDNDRTLYENVESLGGFPIVIKESGLTLGKGVQKADNMRELTQTRYELQRKPNAIPVLKKFIPNAEHIRAVVLGDKVLDALKYLPKEEDFRTNVKARIIAFRRDAGLDQLAVNAVKASECEFGGVDILIDQDNNRFVAEVNSPCDFTESHKIHKVDVAGSIIDYLIDKGEAKKLQR